MTTVDIILPTQPLDHLTPLLDSLQSQAIHIDNVIMVESVRNHTPLLFNVTPPLEFSSSRYQLANLSVLHIHVKGYCPPGLARNLALNHSHASHLAFLDSNTIPDSDWLPTSLLSLERTKSDLSIGSTKYLHSNFFQRILLASSYGFLPLQTLPGTIISRELFHSVGLFLPNVRSGEDIDFIYRSKLFSSKYVLSTSVLTYKPISSSPLFYFLKWIRNYTFSAPYQSLYLQSFVLNLILSILLLFVAVSWNLLTSSYFTHPIYLHHLTKILLFLLLTLYVGSRSFVLPLIRGSFKPGKCSIVDVPFILLTSILLDFAKVMAFLLRSLLSLQNRSH